MSSQTDGHCWIWWDEQRHAQVSFTKPLPRHEAVEYMRVLSRHEVEKLANDKEGVDAAQWINSLLRTVEGQRKHIATLQERIELLTRENGAQGNAGESPPRSLSSNEKTVQTFEVWSVSTSGVEIATQRKGMGPTDMERYQPNIGDVFVRWSDYERLRAALDRVRDADSTEETFRIAVEALSGDSCAHETSGELERLRKLQENALALDDAVAEFGIDKPEYLAEVYQAFHDVLHDGHGSPSVVETKPKPTIEGLERLLQAEDSKQVYVWPDGYVHDTPPPEKAPEAHIDYNVPGCDCLGCELAPKTLVEVRAFGTSIDPPSQKALAPRYELPLEWQAREWTEIDSPSSLCGLLGCNRQTPHHHKAAL